MFRRSLTLIPCAARASARPTSLLTTRYLQSAVQPPTANPDVSRDELKERRGRRPVRAIGQLKTLHPGRLHSSDFVDVSNLTLSRILVDDDRAFVCYGAYRISGVVDYVPFPPNARGFLYYHHDPELPPTSGEIRLRLTPDNDVAGFERGKDLVGLNGSPWAMGLVTLTQPSYEPFTRRLVEDGLFDPALMQKLVERWKGKRVLHPHDRVVHYLEQPFTAQLPRGLSIRIVTPDGIGIARHEDVFRDRRAHVNAVPYSGRVLLRLERSRLPEHTGTRSVVIRVLKILEPIEVVIPGYDMRLPVPKEGDLIHKHDLRRVLRPFSVDLDKTRNLDLRDIGLLYPKVRAGYLLEAAGV
ncbi:hypothetical protein LshimejAT787_0505840 [Lyophyllum shimeji]|uniref:Uncharacterized protein n=1 Tax=Lyophyllum shimeji TaxID=47721 RepID=A0A9P3PNJ5_LYOSH|nr:hypothetical protein LshimejAT787_0505840 [Lyophyllum shimeji]